MTRWILVASLGAGLSLAVACGPGEGDAGTDAPAASEADTEILAYINEHAGEVTAIEDDEVAFDVFDGVVWIAGEVDSDAERAAVIEWAAAVPGVESVEAQSLRVVP